MSVFTEVLKTVKSTTRSVVKHALMEVFTVIQVLPQEVGHSVLLTFDDGPNNEVTPSVLDLLRQYNARAVFFVQGKFVLDTPDYLQTLINDGHVIVNHTFTHNNSLNYRDYVADVARCQKVVEERTGGRPRLFRPPHGRVSPGILNAAYVNHLKPVLWSVTGSADWDPNQGYGNDSVRNGPLPSRSLHIAREAEFAFYRG